MSWRHLIYLILFVPSLAWAHAEPPLSEDFESFGENWVAKANFGILSNTYDGFICEEAFLGGGRYLLEALSEDHYVTLGETSIQVSEDGCEFELIKALNETPSGSDSWPSTNRVVYVTNDDSGPGLWSSINGGRSFELIDIVDTDDYRLTGVHFADENTLVVSGYNRSPDAMGAGLLLRVTLDTGTAEEIDPGEPLKYPYVLDASAGGIVWLGRREGQLVFMGPYDDPTRSEIPEIVSWPSGATISDDASTVWLSGLDLGDGVRRGVFEEGAMAWTEFAQGVSASCVRPAPEGVWVCSSRLLEDADVFHLDPDGTLTPVTHFADIEGPRTCPEGSDVAVVCPVVWNELASYLGKDIEAEDMGTNPDMGNPQDVGDDEPDPPTSQPDEGCSTTSHPGQSALFWFVVLGVGFARRRSKRTC